MKIMHIVEGFGGGVYSFLVDLCNGLSKNHDIILVYSIRPQTPINFSKDFDSNISLINLQMSRSISVSKDIKDFFRILKIIKEHKPDIVHLHSSKAGVLGRLACTVLRYNNNKVYYNPHGYAFLQQNASKLKRGIYFFIEKISATFKGTIIAVSNGEYKETLKFTNKVIEIKNAINNKELDKVIKSKNGALVIGTIGRISYQKNPIMFNEIAKRFPAISFLWIGDGELKEKLSSKNITVTGWVDRYKAIGLMNQLDIYIMTSLWEGMPIALLEAMYMKKVSIVSDVIGNRDVIIDRENGFLASSIDEYENIISELLNDNELMSQIGYNAQSHIISNHLVDDMIKNYEHAYSKEKLDIQLGGKISEKNYNN